MVKLIHDVMIISMCFSMSAMENSDSLITFDAQINGQPVLLAFDTGTEGPVLFRRAVRRLGLEVKEPRADFQPEPGQVAIGITNECLLEFGEVAWKINFGVIDLPGFIQSKLDGVIGWGVISQNIVEISHAPNKFNIHDKLTIDPSQWLCYKIRSDLNLLVMQIPKKGGGYAHVFIDTGSHAGVGLSPERWQLSINQNQDSTLSALFSPGRGLLVIKEIWAKELVLEGLTFTEVPVSKGIEAGEGIVDEGLDAILGEYAISCFSWVIDGSAGKIYVKPNDLTRIPEKYNYNRLGAVFVPHDIRTSNALIAHVVESGPAYSAGIRDCDVLLKIDDVDVTKWRTDPSVMPLSRFWSQSAGTDLNLTLMRDGTRQEISVTLQEIFEN